ncbi:MAG TPA: CmcI family methyltransferase [Acidimicrobiales bacterium]|nr:CmcI family methyltransferase [Acidimicrobiales bacterium]
MSQLPPTVTVDLHEPVLRDYFRARAEQHTQDTYCGVPMSKFPEDLRVYEHLLWLDAPDTVIELGTQFGGSALWFRDRLNLLVSYGRITRAPRVISIDVDGASRRQAMGAGLGNPNGLTFIEGPLEDPAIVNHVAELIGERCMVIEDSAHTFESTTAALEGYARFVPPGGFMVVEDGCVDDEVLRLDYWDRGVRPALDAWLDTDEGRGFVVRRDLELYGVTCHPGGFLQRH